MISTLPARAGPSVPSKPDMITLMAESERHRLPRKMRLRIYTDQRVQVVHFCTTCKVVENMVYEEILSFFRKKGVLFKIHGHEPVVTIREAEIKAPALIGGLLKTVAFRIKDSFWVLAAVRCRDRIDYRKLAAALGVNRRDLRSLSPEEVLRDLRIRGGRSRADSAEGRCSHDF